MTAQLHAKRLWVLAYPAEDVPGEWIAHCLDLDVMTQGPDLRRAMQLALEAVVMVIDHEAAEGRDAFESRKRAPESEWERLEAITRDGQLGTTAELATAKTEDLDAVAWQILVLPTDQRVPKLEAATGAVLHQSA